MSLEDEEISAGLCCSRLALVKPLPSVCRNGSFGDIIASLSDRSEKQFRGVIFTILSVRTNGVKGIKPLLQAYYFNIYVGQPHPRKNYDPKHKGDMACDVPGRHGARMGSNHHHCLQNGQGGYGQNSWHEREF